MQIRSVSSFFSKYSCLLLWGVLLFFGCFSKKENVSTIISNDYLERGFLNPPDSIKPYCYWYWISGNISREGITKDLEAMAKVGIGAAFIGNIGLGAPQGKVKVLSPEWWDLTKHAIREGKRLGVDIGIFNSPGWSQSGGPWVSSSQAMRYMVNSETTIQGGKKVITKLPVPKGAYQDIAVLAFPKPANDHTRISDAGLKVVTTPAVADAGLLFDGDINKPLFFPPGKTFSVEMKTERSYTARSMTLQPAETPFMADVVLQAEVSGSYQTIKEFVYDRSNPNVNVGPMSYGPVTISFPEITATKFRLLFSNIKGKEQVVGTAEAPYKAGLTEIYLSSAPRLESFIEKQLGKMFQTPLPLWDAYLWKEQPSSGQKSMELISSEVIDLTKKMNADGVLDWDAPAGEWIVMRLGASPTGTKNGPASPEATGFEVDKMNRQHLEHHFDAYIGKLLKEMPPEERTAFKYVVADSYEMGAQNYTEGFAADFERKYGYDPLLWLPVLTGRLVGSADQSNRFLWDLRRFVADRVAYDYVGGLRDLAEKNRLKVWLENYGHWGFPSEFLMYGGQSHEIAGEFWTEGTLGNVECRAASSAAHTYGVNRVYAESFTGTGNAFAYYPARLKKRGDWSFTEGINHVLLHVYIHQPYEDKDPGMNAWFGTEFNRKNTWFEQSKTWIDYLRRNMFMLQQGKPVNDVCYFIGEDAPKMTGVRDPEIPKGYSYDYINAEVIIQRMRVKDGQLVLPDGMSYQLLVLPKLETMRPDVLKKIDELVRNGAKVLGPKPKRSPSLQNFPEADNDLTKIADKLWGEGLVMTGMTIQEALDHINVAPDVELKSDAPVLWTHRKTDEADIYFITNQSDSILNIQPIFRVGDKQPELWDATTGRKKILPQYHKVNGKIAVPLVLDAAQSYFVVFKDPLKLSTGINFPEHKIIHTIKGPWEVKFDARRRGPEQKVIFNNLTDWSVHKDVRIKYYSGTATYFNNFTLKSLPKSERIFLQFDEINNMANVKVNGKFVGGLWTAPLKLDITDVIHSGTNNIEIEVVNLWVNRMIGDSKLPSSERKTWLATSAFKPADTLKRSGIIGDVKLLSETLIK